MIFFGELGLDGRLRPVCGVLPAVAAAADAGLGTVMAAEQNAPEGALVPGVRVIAASSLTAAADWLRGAPGLRGGPPAAEFDGGQGVRGGRAPGADCRPDTDGRPAVGRHSLVNGQAAGPDAVMVPDLAEMLGQSMARRAEEACAAGGHHLSLLGPPGTGKTMLELCA